MAFFPGLSLDTARAYFHAGGNCYLWSSAKNNYVTNINVRFDKSLRTQYGIPSEPGLVNIGPQVAAYTCPHHLISHFGNCPVRRPFTGRN